MAGSFWRLWGRMFPWFSWLLEAAHIPWLLASSSSESITPTSASVVTSPSVTLTSCLPLSSWGPWGYIGPAQMIQDNLPLSRSPVQPPAQCLLPCKASQSQVPGMRMRIIGGHSLPAARTLLSPASRPSPALPVSWRSCFSFH